MTIMAPVAKTRQSERPGLISRIVGKLTRLPLVHGEAVPSQHSSAASAKTYEKLLESRPMKSTPAFDTGIRPIFIIGAPRSGTSILTWAIGQHPNIQPMPETAWIANYAVGAFLSYGVGSERQKFSHLSNVEWPAAPFMRRMGEAVNDVVMDVFEERSQRLYGDYRKLGRIRFNPNNPNAAMQIRRSVDDPKTRWIDGTPLNSQFIWALIEMFPEARFIHNLRRPEDVALSLEGFDAVGAVPQQLGEGLATWYQHTENAWLAERAFGPERVFRADFTRLGSDTEAFIRDILAFLGEEYSADCLLPFGKRINSSQVDDRRPGVLERLQSIPAFRRADKLYQEIVEPGPSAPAPDEALEMLRSRFLAHCEGRDLLR